MRRLRMGTLWIALLWAVGLTGCNSLQDTSAGAMFEQEHRAIVFKAYGISFVNPYESRKISSGETVKSASDASNIFFESESGKLRPFFRTNDYQTLLNEVQERGISGRLVWSADPYPAGNGKFVVFASNRETILEGITDKSLHTAHIDGGSVEMALDSRVHGDLRIVDTIRDWVVAESADRSLVLYNVVTREMKKFHLHGHIDAVSEQATHVLFRKTDGDYILPELWMFDIANGSEQRIGDMPEHYFAK